MDTNGKPVGRDGWIAFLAEFEARADKEQTLKSYCDDRGVTNKTAQNWSSKLKKAGDYPGESGQGNKTQGQGRNKPGKKTGNQGKGKNSAGKIHKNQRVTRVRREEIIPDQQGKTQGQRNEPQEKSPSKLVRELNLIPHEPGVHQPDRVRTGLYSRFLPPEIAEEVNSYSDEELRNLHSEIRLTRGRLLLNQQKFALWSVKEMDGLLEDKDYVTKQVKVEVSSGITTRETLLQRPDFEKAEEVLTNRMIRLMQAQANLMSKINMRADDAVRMRQEIYEEGVAEGKSILDIARDIELAGLELPFSIRSQVQAELSVIEPPEPEGGMTDDDLEAAAQEYAEYMADEGEEEEKRAKEIAELRKAAADEKSSQ